MTLDWRHLQAVVRRHCRVSELTRHAGLALLLGGLGAKLEGVARGVMEYLDVKVRYTRAAVLLHGCSTLLCDVTYESLRVLRVWIVQPGSWSSWASRCGTPACRTWLQYFPLFCDVHMSQGGQFGGIVRGRGAPGRQGMPLVQQRHVSMLQADVCVPRHVR